MPQTMSRQEICQVYNLLAVEYDLTDVQARLDRISHKFNLRKGYWDLSPGCKEFYDRHARAINDGTSTIRSTCIRSTHNGD